MNQNPLSNEQLFSSLFIAGFECSNHVLRDGKRLDLIAGTQHDRFVREDYARMREIGITTARDGFRWHLIEKTSGEYDFSSAIPMLRAARENRIQVIWDLLHFGWPDHVDVFSDDFVTRFENFVRALLRVLDVEGDAAPYISPVNEISFLSWAGGDAGFFNPFLHGRGHEMKQQLAKAAIAACRILREWNPQTRLFHVDPMIQICAFPDRPQDRRDAEGHRQAMFQSWDMISGAMYPELGGAPSYLDVVGVNYYSNNQWIHGGGTIGNSHPQYVPLRFMLREVFERYNRPLFIAETGIEDNARPDWLRYVCQEVRGAQKLGVSVSGITLYPVLNHPGWDDDRHCYNGLWDYADENGHREIYQPLWQEMQHQSELFARADEQSEEQVSVNELDAAAQHIAELDAATRHD